MSKPDSVVFVVDDDASVRDAIQSLLRSVGLHVESYASAQEFLRSKRPDLPGCIVLDVRLPGFSGLELQRKLYWFRRAVYFNDFYPTSVEVTVEAGPIFVTVDRAHRPSPTGHQMQSF
jgi:DNA-binding NarL/FixJ family response regulator